MKPFFKFIVIVSIIPLLIALCFFDNVKGYYRFKQYCAKEGGLRVYKPIEENVGWLAKNRNEARTAALLEKMNFVRYVSQENGVVYDLYYVGGNPGDGRSYAEGKASDEKPSIYEWSYINEKNIGGMRIGKYGYEIINIKDTSLVARYYMFEYSWFDRSKTLLDSQSFSDCYFNKINSFGEIEGWKKSLIFAFDK